MASDPTSNRQGLRAEQSAKPDKYAIKRVERCLIGAKLIDQDATVQHVTIDDQNIVVEDKGGHDHMLKTGRSIRGTRSDKRLRAMDCRFEITMP
jgi:hypothetical protein